MITTGVPIFDAVIKLGLDILAAVLFLMMGARMLKMLHRHEYAQLIASMIMFVFAFFFINDPNDAKNLLMSLFHGTSTHLQNGGGGGTGTGG